MGDIDPSESRPRLRSHVVIDPHIDSHALGVCSDDEGGRECFQQPPEEFPRSSPTIVLTRLGVLPCALEGWSHVYKSPLEGILVTSVACCAYWGTLSVSLAQCSNGQFIRLHPHLSSFYCAFGNGRSMRMYLEVWTCFCPPITGREACASGCCSMQPVQHPSWLPGASLAHTFWKLPSLYGSNMFGCAGPEHRL